MGDESDAPAYLAAVGLALLLGAAWVALMPFDGLPAPLAPLVMLAVAACFALGASAKAAERRH